MDNSFIDDDFENNLVLAAEEFSDDDFEKYHIFSEYENRIIRKLVAHGPVLLCGGRGTGKSALFKEAFFRMNKPPISERVFGVYISFRYIKLLRSEGEKYEKLFCKYLADEFNTIAKNKFGEDYFVDSEYETSQLQKELIKFSNKINRRIVLLFDDVAHLGREISLKEFFDIFRILSCQSISCKATIYPGITEYGGIRMDFLNDANIIDIARNEDNTDYTTFFKEILNTRYSSQINVKDFSSIPVDIFADFMGRVVIGNVRAFIFACNFILENKTGEIIGVAEIEKTLKYLANEYYWPMLDEIKPKLGCYEPLIEPAMKVAEFIFKSVSRAMSESSYNNLCLIHRDHIERLKKLFELLEYAGFIIKKDASLAMKSGGRGTRYVLNLCNIMEYYKPNRLSHDIISKWRSPDRDSLEIYKGGELENIQMPEYAVSVDLSIFSMSISNLKKSKAYPYGLTDKRISILNNAGIDVIAQITELSDEELLRIKDIGDYWLQRIRNVVAQAIWM